MQKLIFQNDHWVLAQKMPMTLSVPGRQGEADTRPCLGRLLETQLQKRIYPVHRLDYEVGGLILYALTPQAHRAGQSWFEHEKIFKTYHALTEGDVSNMPTAQAFDWHNKIVRGKKRSFEAPHGKDSHTRAIFHGLNQKQLLKWELHPTTGRPHQLRMQLAMRLWPIVGDTLYGSKTPWPEGIALRAVALDLSKIPASQRLGLSETYLLESWDEWK
jgi:tRNA pseudouridine32 synthase/23S rRNA pseudouridine746 synthase